MVWYIAVQENPWSLTDVELRDAMHKVWAAIYGDVIPHWVEIDDAVFYVVITSLFLLSQVSWHIPVPATSLWVVQQDRFGWSLNCQFFSIPRSRILKKTQIMEILRATTPKTSTPTKTVKNSAKTCLTDTSLCIVIGQNRYVMAYIWYSLVLTLHQRPTGLFAGPLIIRTFTVYFSGIEGAVKVPALGDVKAYPYGALGLSAASVSTVTTIWDNANNTWG